MGKKLVKYVAAIVVLLLVALHRPTYAQSSTEAVHVHLDEVSISDSLATASTTDSYESSGQKTVVITIPVSKDLSEVFDCEPQEVPLSPELQRTYNLKLCKLTNSHYIGILILGSDGIEITLKNKSTEVEYSISKKGRNTEEYYLSEKRKNDVKRKCYLQNAQGKNFKEPQEEYSISNTPARGGSDVWQPNNETRHRKYRLAILLSDNFVKVYDKDKLKALKHALMYVHTSNEILKANLNFSSFVTCVVYRPIRSTSSAIRRLNSIGEALQTECSNTEYDIGEGFGIWYLDLPDVEDDLGGETIFGGACGNQPEKGASAIYIDEKEPVSLGSVDMAHEIGHQFSLNHLFESCDDPNQTPDRIFEAGDGYTIMSYPGVCNPIDAEIPSVVKSPFFSPVSRHTYSFQRRVRLPKSCGIVAGEEVLMASPEQPVPYLPNSLPHGTAFSLYLPPPPANTFYQIATYSPLSVFQGYYRPNGTDLNSQNSKTMIRFDYPFPFADGELSGIRYGRKVAPSNPRNYLEKWQLNFHADLLDGKGGAKYLSTSNNWKSLMGHPFGFRTFKAESWESKKEYEIEWNTGIGSDGSGEDPNKSIADVVDVVFVWRKKKYDYGDLHTAFPETFEKYEYLAKKIPNSGKAKITAPAKSGVGTILLLPYDDWYGQSQMLSFWSRAGDITVKCPNGEFKVGCGGEEGPCECEEPTATPTPGAETPTGTATALPSSTPTVTFTPTASPSPTSSPVPTPTLTATAAPTNTPGGPNRCQLNNHFTVHPELWWEKWYQECNLSNSSCLTLQHQCQSEGGQFDWTNALPWPLAGYSCCCHPMITHCVE